MKLDVIDFARRVGISVEEVNKWLEANETEVDVLIGLAYNEGYEDGYNEYSED